MKSAEFLQQAALEEYGPDLHVALRSRRDELLYLRKLTEMLFPYILPPKAMDCRYGGHDATAAVGVPPVREQVEDLLTTFSGLVSFPAALSPRSCQISHSADQRSLGWFCLPTFNGLLG